VTEFFARPLAYLTQNRISQAGVVIATSATIFWLFLLAAGGENPYLGILTLGLLPLLLLIGLSLIPIGLWHQRRSGKVLPPLDPRRLVGFLALTTVVNLVIASQTGYRAVEYMDSVAFCGQTCHTPMTPEFTAYSYAPHSQVPCVKCHIGAGAKGMIKAKMNGLRQAIGFMAGSYHRPIPPPTFEELPTVKETCETCHARSARTGEKLRVLQRYQDDEASTPKYTVLMVRLGAIHKAHFNSAKPELGGGSCRLCHNRPAHSFETPEDAVDRAITATAIDRKLPFAHKNAVAALRVGTTGVDAAKRFLASYGTGGKAAEISAAHVRAIFERNVFPEMKIGWGAYPNHLGHPGDKDGCFRCHDGAKATQDCGACHTLVAMEEADPKVLKDLGVIEEAAK
jgi:hypothetical protein